MEDTKKPIIMSNQDLSGCQNQKYTLGRFAVVGDGADDPVLAVLNAIIDNACRIGLLLSHLHRLPK